MTVVFGLGTRLRVRMRTTFENGVLRNGQQPGSAVNSFIDLGEFGAMKTLSSRMGFTKFTQLHVVTSQFVMVITCALRVRIEDRTGSRHDLVEVNSLL